MGIILENKVPPNSKLAKAIINRSCSFTPKKIIRNYFLSIKLTLKTQISWIRGVDKSSTFEKKDIETP